MLTRETALYPEPEPITPQLAVPELPRALRSSSFREGCTNHPAAQMHPGRAWGVCLNCLYSVTLRRTRANHFRVERVAQLFSEAGNALVQHHHDAFVACDCDHGARM